MAWMVLSADFISGDVAMHIAITRERAEQIRV
jgi:hypothetical protein